MRLLIVTQAIDTEHPILGFFHRWVEEFAKHCGQVHVICLQAGRHSLPANVTVHSLGKELGKGRLTYLWRFYKLIWTLRHEYDNVFVHMNQIYVILGAPFWRIAGKKVGLWYAHGAVPTSLVVAEKLAHEIFTSTSEGFRLPSKKIHIVGQGIDVSVFRPAEHKDFSPSKRLITVGRISPSKNIATLLEACALLKSRGGTFNFTIIGSPQIEGDILYQKQMKELIIKKGIEDQVLWMGSVSNYELPKYLQQADVFIQDSSTNSLDKALLEAALSGCAVVSSNLAYVASTKSIAKEYLYDQGDSTRLATILEDLNVTDTIKNVVREYFFNKYTVSNLISDIIHKY